MEGCLNNHSFNKLQIKENNNNTSTNKSNINIIESFNR